MESIQFPHSSHWNLVDKNNLSCCKWCVCSQSYSSVRGWTACLSLSLLHPICRWLIIIIILVQAWYHIITTFIALFRLLSTALNEEEDWIMCLIAKQQSITKPRLRTKHWAHAYNSKSVGLRTLSSLVEFVTYLHVKPQNVSQSWVILVVKVLRGELVEWKLQCNKTESGESIAQTPSRCDNTMPAGNSSRDDISETSSTASTSFDNTGTRLRRAKSTTTLDDVKHRGEVKRRKRPDKPWVLLNRYILREIWWLVVEWTA